MAISPLPLLASDLAACCSPLSGGALDEETAERLARVFHALGDRHRVRLLSLIAAADGGEACICDLVAPVGLAQPTISHHMKLLVEAGLVTREQRGKWAYYRLAPEAAAPLSDMLRVLLAAPPGSVLAGPAASEPTAVQMQVLGVTEMTDQTKTSLREEVRERYAQAARVVLDQAGSTSGGCCGSSAEASCCGTGSAALDSAEWVGAGLYGEGETEGLPEAALLASLGCGNPVAVAELHEGERVLDLGSGGGIDVLLSARRVGPSGFAYGVDMTDDMLTLARANAVKAGATNVEFRKGEIEALPLPDASVDVVISNCVINLSTDKPAVLAEMFRVLVPGGRIGISDVVAEDHLTPADRAAAGSYTGCIAGALSRTEYLDGLRAAGFADPQVTFTNEATPGMHSAIIRAVKPA